MKESELRDILSSKLGVIEAQLVFKDKEKYIPNHLGTRGFIDIYATDANNKHVLIELKKSKSTSRETLNEILKYVEGVKSYFGCREDEIRVIVVATDWSELLVPFSRLLSDTTISIAGKELIVNENPISLICKPITPLNTNNGRFIAPWYDFFWYKNHNSLEKGISSIEKNCKNKKILNYFLLVLSINPAIPSIPRSKRIGILSKLSPIKNIEPELYEYIVVFSQQINTEKEYLDILLKDEDVYNSTLESLDDYIGDDRLCILHEAIRDMEPYPYSEDIEIGNPEKLYEYLNSYGFIVKDIYRYGSFLRNQILNDATILNEIIGFSGNSSHKLKKKINLSDKSQSFLLKEEIKSVLWNNEVWRDRILLNISSLEAEHPNCTIDIDLFSPSSGFFTIYNKIVRDDGFIYLPYYFINVEDDGFSLKYFGALDIYGKAKKFDEIVDSYYNGQVDMLIHTISSGGYEPRDNDIMDDAGLIYRNYRVEESESEIILYAMRDGKWRREGLFEQSDFFERYIIENKDFIDDLLANIYPYDNGFYFSSVYEKNIIVSRDEVESKDLSKILNKLKPLIISKKLASKSEGKIEISFDGYNHDSRELFQINEVIDYVKSFSNEFPYLFYFIKKDSVYKTLLIIYLCHYHDKNSDEACLSFFNDQFCGLNQITDWLNMSLDENKRITEEVTNSITGI
ncbi:hypothetical protein [Dickeya zeae]|uniref:hypothetical protein n=1 Tax=Dickeya zeae TaxID=204042 RepID=UPI001C6300E4|nr:hypothetical protein [Dickeya zeae]